MADKQNHISAPKPKHVYTLSPRCPRGTHPSTCLCRTQGGASLLDFADRPGCLSSQAHIVTLIMQGLTICPWLAHLAAGFPITLSLLAFGPTRSCLLWGSNPNLVREFRCSGVLNPLDQTQAGKTNQYVFDVPGVSCPSAPYSPRVRWFLPKVLKMPLL